MKKLLCFALSAIMLCGMTSCDDHDHSHANMVGNVDDEKGDVKQEDMPYGATIYELRPEYDSRVKYIMEFDKRYFGWDGENNDLSEELTKRNDDNEETFKAGYAAYLENATPVIEYFREKGILIELDASGSPEYTLEQLEKVIGSKND